MRIRGLSIESFGSFSQFDMKEFSPGITVFYGPNEAGKSTLMSFIRTVLYGFPARLADQFYAPRIPGRHGGRLRVENAEGEFLLERYSTKNSFKITRPDGELGTLDDHRRLLCFSTEAVFNNIFSFGLTELQDFETLSIDEVKERIFSGSVSGTGPSARSAIQALDRKSEELLKKKSKVSRLGSLMSDYREIEVKILNAKDQAKDYQNLLRREEQHQSEVSQFNLESEKYRREHAHLQLLLDLWPEWTQKQSLIEELNHSVTGVTIPKEVAARVNQCVIKTESEEQKRAEWVTDLEAWRRELERMVPDEALLRRLDRIKRVSQEIPLYRANLERRRELDTAVFEAESLARDAMMELGPDWEEARIIGIDRSVLRQEEARKVSESLVQVRGDLSRVEQEEHLLEKKIQELKEGIRTLEEAIERSGVSAFPEDFAESEKMIRSLKAGFLEYKSLRERRDTLSHQIADRKDALAAIDPESEAPPVPFIALPILGFLIAGTATFGIWRVSRHDYIQALMAGMGFLVLVMIAAIFVRIQLRLKRRQERESGRLISLKEQIATEEAQLESTVARIYELESSIVELSKQAGKDQRVSEVAEIEILESEWLNQKTVSERNSEKRETLDALTSKCQFEEKRLTEVRSTLRKTLDQLMEIERGFQRWKNESGLPDDLSPSGVIDFFEKVRIVRDRILIRDRMKNERADLERSLEAWVSEVDELTAHAEGDAIDRLSALLSQAEIEHRKNENSLYRQSQVRELEVKVESVDRRISNLKLELQTIFSEVGVKDQYQFENCLAQSERTLKSREALREIELRFQNRLGSKHTVEKFEEEFMNGSLESWQFRAEELESKMKELQKQRDHAIGEWKALSVERERLEASVDVPAYELERARILTEIREAAHAWSVYQCARGLIEESLSVFEKEHQPKVLAQASRIFSRITSGKYERVVQGESGNEVVVIDSRGMRKPADQLSRGTAEQLYLSLRLGLAHSFSNRQGALPLIMDDVCVNFDPERTSQVIRAIVEFAQVHQIFYFTCQPWVRDEFLKVSDQIDVRELQGDRRTSAQDDSLLL